MSNYDLAPSTDNDQDKDSKPEPIFYSEQPSESSKSLMDLFTGKETHGVDELVPPTVALEKEMERERQLLAEKQKEAELRQTQAMERMQLMQKRELDQKEDTYSQLEKENSIAQDLEIDSEATSEKTFDRRHEVLDRQYPAAQFEPRNSGDARALDNVPVSIAQVISDRESASLSPETPRADLPENLQQVSNLTYKKSLQAGFIVGVTAVFIGLIIYFIFK